MSPHASAGMMEQVFISYSHQDRELVSVAFRILAIAGTIVCGYLLIMIFGGAFSAMGMLLVGMVAGSAAVRRLRRLEPGILGRQASWVVLG